MDPDELKAELVRFATELGAAVALGDFRSALSLQMRIAALCDPGPRSTAFTAHRLARRFLMRAMAVEGRCESNGELRHAQEEARLEIEAVSDLLASSIDPVFDPHPRLMAPIRSLQPLGQG